MIKSSQFHLIAVIYILLLPTLNYGQAPALGTTTNFALYTAVGAFNAAGASTIVTGDVGTNVGAFNAFPPGVLVGQVHVADPVSATAATDVAIAYSSISTVTCGLVISTTLGNGQVLLPNVYCTGAATTLNGDLILDGQGNPNSLFIFKFGGALSTAVDSRIVLTNGASICNIWWQVDGAVNLGENSIFRGSLLVNGAIHLLDNAKLFGRALSKSGAISLQNNIVTLIKSPIASVITANGPKTFCAGNSVTLAGNLGGTWSTGATTPTINVTTSGDFFVTNTSNCGSAISNHIVVSVNPLPICSITGIISICPRESTQLCAPAGLSSYLWSTGATTQCITVSTAGLYSVTVSSSGGCSSSCNTTVIVKLPPIGSITGNNSICAGGSTQLCAPVGLASYLWSTGATTQCINVSIAGMYKTTITNTEGCTNVLSKSITVYANPICTITGSGSICQGQSTQLCTALTPGNIYQWSTGAITSCISINLAGTYKVTVTNSKGCTSICSKTVTVASNPNCTITGMSGICQGSSTLLCTQAGSTSYLWSTGACTNCIAVTNAGTYTVKVTNASGCSSTCTKTVTVNSVPNCTISGIGTICQGSSTQLCTPPGCDSYLWSTGASTNCIMVSAAGTYKVTTTNSSGCSSICSKLITMNPAPSSVITGNLSPAPGQSTTLCAPSGMTSYLWNTGASTSCITVTNAGSYSVTVTNSYGCIASSAVSVNCYAPLASGRNYADTLDAKYDVIAYPNPFNSVATIEVQHIRSNSHVLIELYNETGQRVAILMDMAVEKGSICKAEVNGETLPKGIYMYRIINGNIILNRKLILIK